MDKIAVYKKIQEGETKVQETFMEIWYSFILYWNRNKSNKQVKVDILRYF